MSKVLKTKHPYLAILGPTASGKSSLAFKLAQEFGGEIVSCDSVQLYKGFDIGSAKASLEEQSKVKHHMIDLLEPEESFDAAQYAELAREKILDIIARGKLPILVGGTGLYYRFLAQDKVHALPGDKALKESLKELTEEELVFKLMELDPQRAKKIHKNDRYRLVRSVEIALSSQSNFSTKIKEEEKPSFFPKLCVLLDPLRKDLHEKIEKRSKLMLSQGLVEEVRSLRGKYSPGTKAMETIGYKQVNKYLDLSGSDDELLFRIVCATRQYAKRQVTFFKKVAFDYSSESPKEDYEEICELVRSSFFS